MRAEQVTEVVQRWRGTPIFPPEDAGGEEELAGIIELLPHREPFLLVDFISAFDANNGRLRASRQIAADDPVFSGHFPGQPIYPGVLTVEALGQAALCLLSLLNRKDQVGTPAPPNVRVTRLHHAVFLRQVGPNDVMDMQVALLERDTLLPTFVGQVWTRDALSCLVVGEFYVLD